MKVYLNDYNFIYMYLVCKRRVEVVSAVDPRGTLYHLTDILRSVRHHVTLVILVGT